MRTKATVSSFVLVCVLYFLYGWGLVPLVLPNPSDGEIRTTKFVGENTAHEDIAPFAHLLPLDGWEHTDPDIRLLRLGKTIILFGKDRPEGRFLKLEPCTVLILPNDAESPNQESTDPITEAVVLRAPKAEIEFDRDFDYSKFPMPNPIAGYLLGGVTIEGGSKDSGKNDDFSLVTDAVGIDLNVKEDETETTRIRATNKVRFRWGFHSGVGTGLELNIIRSNSSLMQASTGLKNARFDKVEFLRLVFPENPNTPSKLIGGVTVPDGPATTIDVRCDKHFEFIANPAEQGWTASFHQNVDMIQNNPDKTVDRLTADRVYLTLASVKPAEGTVATKNSSSPFSGLEPLLFIAHGKPGQGSERAVPARLSVKQNTDVTLVGDEIYLDLRKNFLSLSTRKDPGGSPHVEMILADQYTIRSEQTVQYTLGPKGAFGKFASVGRGDLTGKTGEGTAAKDVYLTWNEMQIEPYPPAQDQVVLKLNKGISARMTGFGTMTAGSIDLFCNVAPSNSSGAALPGAGKSNMTLDHAVVKDNVVFSTKEGTCEVRQLNIFFTNVIGGRAQHSRWMPQVLSAQPPTAPVIASSRLNATVPQPIQQVQHLQPLTQQHLIPAQSIPLYQPATVTAPAQAAPAYAGPPSNPLPQSPRPATGFVETQNLLGMKSSPNGGKFKMTGDQMRMRVQMQNGQSAAEVVAIEGNVRLQENIPNNVPAGAPNTAIDITGDTVTIWYPSDPNTKISILGHANGGEAVFKGKGAELRSRELHISRQDNTFWSPGPGRLTANVAQINAPGMPNANTDSLLTVDWNKEMACDGLVLQFVGQSGNSNRVQTLYQTYTMWCSLMEIRLNRKVMFFEDQSPVEPKAVEIKCSNDVSVRNRQVDALGRQKSVDFIRAVHLHYDVQKNYFVADGPGEISSMFLGSGHGFDKTSNNSAGTPSNLAGTPGKETLNYLVVWFLNGMQGSLQDNNKKIDIQGRVESVYCPAANWNDTISRENITAAKRTGYIMECERLQIVEVPDPSNLLQSTMELTASTNAVIEGSDIFGKAREIKYNQAKSTVQMDGDVDLRLTQGQRIRTESVRYNIATGTVEMIQTQGGGFGQ